MYGVKGSSTETHKSFPLNSDLRGEKILKRISTYCTKCYEINIRHLDLFLSYKISMHFVMRTQFKYKVIQCYSKVIKYFA